jgi:ferredoxin-NADP reductase
MRVDAVVRETADAVTLELSDWSGAKLSFQPGQFFSVRADVAGETLWRAYSICTAPGSSKLAITIKRVSGGRVSNHLNERARPGETLEVRGPSGRFTLADGEPVSHLVLIGGGSGITPLMSHLRHQLGSEAGPRVTLLYGNRGERDVIFREALDALAVEHASRFRLRYLLSEPGSMVAGQGMLDRAITQRELDALGVADGAQTLYLMCGPEPMLDAVREALLARGVDAARIREERFSAPKEPETRSIAEAREQPLTLRVRGLKRQVVAKPGQTILEAALAHQVPLEFSCTMGGCGSCIALLEQGEVRMDEPNCLSATERAQHKILTCVAHPISPCQVETP